MYTVEKDISIFIITEEEAEKEPLLNGYKEIRRTKFRLKDIHFCRLELYSEKMFGTVRIPKKDNNSFTHKFAFYMNGEQIIFIDNTDTVKNIVEQISVERIKRKKSIHSFMEEFLLYMIEDDQIYLEDLENEIEDMESKVLKDELQDFNSDLLKIKKKISKMHSYYNQLFDMVEDFQSHTGDEETLIYHVFENKTARLLQETVSLREYTNQVQDVYMSEISLRQNNVMKVLTIVTTIFLPLTLIVGWYGMNFVGMPELTWKYGYRVIIIVSILIVVISLMIFKKKKIL